MIFVETPWGQKIIINAVTKRLARDLQTKISINHVDFSLFNQMNLDGVLVEDRGRDTLLYAGEVRVRVTDWFFFKKKAELKYIGLKDALIKFQRTDSVWSQQFFLDYFASPSSGKKKKNAGIQFNLKKMELDNVSFIKKDAWLGQDLFIHTGSLFMDANNISLSGTDYDINKLNLIDPVFSQYNYKGLKPSVKSILVNNTTSEVDTGYSWNMGNTIIKIGSLKIKNGTLKLDKQTDRLAYDYFDGQHILFSQIDGEIKDSRLIGDTVFSRIELSAKERSGLELKNMTAALKLSPKEMAFADLELTTNKSTIRNYFSMSYDDISDM
ncbi:MAG: hypothetical protein ABUT20_30540, partial [Bacteroidota bacterium]